MTYRETIYLNEKDIKTIIAKAFNTEETNISNTTISRCCRGKAKTAGGYIWRLKEE